MDAARVPCGSLCGTTPGDLRWAHLERRLPAGLNWGIIGFDRLGSTTLSDVEATHVEATKLGQTYGVGVAKPHFLGGIWQEYTTNIADRVDPVYTATRWVKHSVLHRPFRDANRRTAFIWAATIFRAFDVLLRVDTGDAIEFKTTVKNKDFDAVYAWFEREIEKARG